MLRSGDWKSIQHFRKNKRSESSKLRSLDGNILTSNERIDRLARYLEQVQWAVRPDTIPNPNDTPFKFSDMNCNSFTPHELQ
eukprot:6798338-Karenia_brevis.AAC.1